MHPGGSKAPSALPKSIFSYIWQTSHRHQIALAVLAVAVFLLSMGPLELQRRIINSALEAGASRKVAWLSAGYGGLALISGALKLALNVYRGWVSESAVRRLRRTVYDRIAEDQHCDDPRQSGVGMSIILAEADPVGGFVGMSLSEPLLQGGTLLTVLGYMAFLQPWMALFSFILFSLQVLFVPPLQRAMNRRAGGRIKTLRELSGDMIGDLGPGPTSSEQKREFLRRINRVFHLNMQVYWLKFTMNFLMNLVYHLGIVGVLLVGGWYVLQHQLEIGTVVAFISGLARVNEPWGDLVNYFRELTTAQVKYGLIAKVMAQPSARTAQTKLPSDMVLPA
jgi:ABC-type multidrug transport system fused ATPase/permease subunit